MDGNDQINAFADELDRLVNQFRSEWDLSYAAIIGCLEMKKQTLCQEAIELGGWNEDEEGED